jgi:predicted O-linked N-acetylglucosamine transferase (SPINDLY family)
MTHDVSDSSNIATNSLAAMLQNALQFHQQGEIVRAEALYREILRQSPRNPDALHLLGLIAEVRGRNQEAVELLNQAISVAPTQPLFHLHRGQLFLTLAAPERALVDFDSALRLSPDSADAHFYRADALETLGRLEESVVSLDAAIHHRPGFSQAYSNRGLVLRRQGKLEESLASYDEAIRLNPGDAISWNNRGTVLKDLQRWEEALAHYDEATRLSPGFANSFDNRGQLFRELRQFEKALACHDQSLRLRPNHAPTLILRGNALLELRRLDEALNCYDAAIRLRPDDANAHANRAAVLKLMQQPEEALASFDEALRLQRQASPIFGKAAHASVAICQWNGLEQRVEAVTRGIQEGRLVTSPWPLLSLVDSPELHRKAAEIWQRQKVHPSGQLGAVPQKTRRRKIHVAYLAAIFHQHAGSTLMAQLFETHDRDRFEVTAISFGPDTRDPMRQRLQAAFDRFVDVRSLSNLDIARLCRQLDVDIAIDRAGFTQDNRATILAERCAPLQINWLAYPGTMGAPFIDYIIADSHIITPADLPHYSEQVLWLPDSYMVNDGHRAISDRVFTRTECGLPEQGFVFCCFNNNFKILPPTFDIWMRIFQRVPGSVLWLLEDNPAAARNLRAEAAARGIDPGRLVFAPRLPLPEHLARHRVADLFLDTWPCNAHTTASDALWAGLPLLTRPGRSFASRVAASLLHAIGLPELITHTDGDYEELAVALANDPRRLAALKDKLAANRLTQPLFDCPRFTRHLEAAYLAVMERHWRGEAPCHLRIPPQPAASPSSARGRQALVAPATTPPQDLPEPTDPSPNPPGTSSPLSELVAAALQHHQRGELDLAEELYSRILERHPTHPDALHLRGVLACQRGQHAAGVAFITQAIEANPPQATYFLNRGIALRDLQRPQEALEDFEHAVRLDPGNAAVFRNRGITLRDLGRLEEALASYDHAIRLNPNAAEAYFNRGNLLRDLRRHEEALADYDRALQHDPSHAVAFNNRGNVLLELRLLDQALASYCEALRLKPDYAAAHTNHGNALREMHRYSEALASYDKALGLNPSCPKTLNNRGITWHHLRRFSEAIQDFTESNRLDPEYADAYLNRAHSLEELKRLE